MILDRIVKAKQEEVAFLKQGKPLEQIKDEALDTPLPRNFGAAVSGTGCSIIAEIKRRSPSKGRIRDDFDHIDIALCYENHGAAAISVLTDQRFFEGERSYLSEIKRVVSVPLLRKDFIIDSYQVYETRVLGGDALLLIAGLMDLNTLRDFISLTESLGLSPLVEVHSAGEMKKALGAGAKIIGINNRNLKTFEADLKISLDLLSAVPKGRTVISESGIHTRGDIEMLMSNGIHAFLVGETLMGAADIGAKLDELLGTVNK
ncbi:MAG: indole-3-glycerol phosphate synthase TrpC [Thermodesulfobacteriota bacterium]|nr:indole-3-glycerol phosphate synthase TrpC [Thermodesulfobacteriota bacterium]